MEFLISLVVSVFIFSLFLAAMFVWDTFADRVETVLFLISIPFVLILGVPVVLAFATVLVAAALIDRIRALARPKSSVTATPQNQRPRATAAERKKRFRARLKRFLPWRRVTPGRD